VPRAVPGKALKRKISAEVIRNRQSSYEAKRKDRKLNPSWQKDRRYRMFHPITKTDQTKTDY